MPAERSVGNEHQQEKRDKGTEILRRKYGKMRSRKGERVSQRVVKWLHERGSRGISERERRRVGIRVSRDERCERTECV